MPRRPNASARTNALLARVVKPGDHTAKFYARWGTEIEKGKMSPQPVSFYERVTRAEGSGRVWAATRMGGTAASAAEVERAMTGDLRERAVKTALLAVWNLFEKHATEVGGGEGQVEEKKDKDEEEEEG